MCAGQFSLQLQLIFQFGIMGLEDRRVQTDSPKTGEECQFRMLSRTEDPHFKLSSLLKATSIIRSNPTAKVHKRKIKTSLQSDNLLI